jgi:hypothetical protein
VDFSVDPPDPKKLQSQKQTACILALVAAAGLMFAAVSKRWLAADVADAGLGPRGWSCEPAHCGAFPESASNAEISDHIAKAIREFGASSKDKPSPVFPIVGWITLAGCIIAAAALIGSAATAWKGAVPIKPIPPTSVALLALFIVLISGMVFVATHPFKIDGKSPIGVSTAFWIFGVSNVLGIVGAQMLAKFKAKDPNELSI